MEHLVVVCLIGFQIYPPRAELIKKKLNELALRLRPSFFRHFGLEMILLEFITMRLLTQRTGTMPLLLSNSEIFLKEK